MKTSEWVVTTGSTVEEAVQAAAEQLNATKDEIEYVVEEAPRKGWLGLWHWRARIRARRIEPSESSPDAAEIAEAVAEAEDARDAEHGPSENAADEARDAAHDNAEDAAQDADVPAHPVRAFIGLENGQVLIETPEGRMGDPVIRPGPNASVWVNDELLEGPRPVTEDDVIRVEAETIPPETAVEVHISEDELTASVAVFMRAGMRYQLRDSPPSMQLTVIGEAAGEIPPEPPTRKDLQAALAERGVVFGISDEALDDVLQKMQDNPAEARKPTPVAFGIPMKPTIDEGIELKFERDARVRTVVEEDRADLLALYKLQSVKPGTVLAIKQPGSKGQPGRTVKGKVLPVKEPRPLQVRVGDGAAWNEDGTKVYATRGGRPTIVRNLITVQPQHTVQGDADATTGHIEFDGDVAITGSVGDSLRVVSKGSVTIGNNVSNALVEADESVTIGRGIVRSKVVAGARYARFFQVMAYLDPLSKDLRALMDAVEELKFQSAFAAGEGDVATDGRPDGGRIKRVLDDDFPHLERRIQQFHEFVQQDKGAQTDRELVDFAASLRRMLVGLGPLALKNVAELLPLRRRADEYVAEFRQLQEASFDVVAGFIDNSEVLAGGQIVLQRGGCSYSKLWAGSGVVIKSGVFRGTSITVDRGDVVLQEAGSRSGASITIEIVNEGRIRANLIHPGVAVAIGNRRHTFRHEERGVRVSLVDGELSIRTGIF